jgi:hypothetical protein
MLGVAFQPTKQLSTIASTLGFIVGNRGFFLGIGI